MATQIQVSIDRNSPVPLYHQLAEQLAAAIDTGVLKPGTRSRTNSPSRRSPGPVPTHRPAGDRRVGDARTAGSPARHRHHGRERVIHRRNELTSLFDDLKRNGRKPLTEVLEFNTDFVDQRASQILGLPVETLLVYPERLRSGRRGSDVHRATGCRRWADIDMKCSQPGALQRDEGPRRAPAAARHQTIGARPAEPSERKLLQLDKTDPVLNAAMSRKAYDLPATRTCLRCCGSAAGARNSCRKSR